ncbi:MAG: phosphoribosyltransferase family protein [Armatimonadota bacterium]|nr:phosphoribosyltransferase family protein [Armatimonadota bacterium]
MFKDRTDAGRQLAQALLEYRSTGAVVLAIPMGGVPVGAEVARKLGAPLDLVIPRKLPIPWNPEAGFGAMTIDGEIVLNRQLIESMHITKQQIEVVCEMVKTEIERRNKALRHDKPAPNVKGRTAIIVDDGLASGYTMLAAIRYVRSLGPSKIVAAVPAASAQSALLVEKETDELVVLIKSAQIPFAVAGFYLSWHDLSDEEVKACLEEYKTAC